MQIDSELLTLGELVKQLQDKSIVVPLLQRNYKWDMKNNGKNNGEATVEKFLKDIQQAKASKRKEYTIGMATLYIDSKNNEIQIIDGQQRMITLSLIVKALGCYNQFPHIKFERDTESKERESFLCNDVVSDSVDVKHMKAVYDFLKIEVREENSSFFDWMKEHVKIICRYTENEPLQEFLNLNEKKTPFSSTDYDRAYQLKYQSGLQKITPAMIIKEHNEIEKYLYVDEDIFNLIKERYDNTPNRMDLIFEKTKSNFGKLSDYYEKLDTRDEEERSKEYKKNYDYLKYCHKVLRSIHQELEKREQSSLNVNIYNAVVMLYRMNPNFKFFDLIDYETMDKTFEKKLLEQFNLLGEMYNLNESKNAFMQSQLDDEIQRSKMPETLDRRAYRETEQYVSNNIMGIFEKKVRETEELIEKGKNYSELIEGGKKSFFNILNCSEIKKIIVPKIQRDYTLGSDEVKLRKLFFDISKTCIQGYLQECDFGKYKKGTAAKVVYNSIKEGKIWTEPGYITSPNRSDIKKKCKYEFLALGTDELLRLAGTSIDEYVTRWNYNDEKLLLNCELKKLYNSLKLNEDDLENIKNSTYFWDNNNYNREEFLFSIILGYLEDGNFYLYDGQQRIVTLIYLCAYIINQSRKQKHPEVIEENSKYIELLKKFEFEERKEANNLLLELLEKDIPVQLENLEKYVTDHSTYSIVKLLKTYEGYKNGYDKDIMGFDLQYLMNNILFEFAVVKEASVADQLYMDLNSKNVPLTHYENYKAELVYILSQRYNTEFDKNWKYQLDNNFLDICFDKQEWEKVEADEAEKMEISIIHWCFKMACMEHGIDIGNIDDAKKRLRWMEDTEAKKIIELVGNLLNKKILVRGSKYKSAIFQQIVNGLNTGDFNEKEFEIWHDIRCIDGISKSPSKFLKNAEYVRVNNLSPNETRDFAKYIISLAKIKQKEENSKDLHSDMIKFLLRNFHFYWSSGYLQVDAISILPGYYLENNDIDEKKVSDATNYFSEAYLKKKPEGIKWIEFIYNIKLNERTDIGLYEKVREWEKAEYELEKVFEYEEKKKAEREYGGNYALWKYATEKIEAYKIDLKADIKTGIEIVREVIENTPNDAFKMKRLSKNQIQKHKIEINFKNNQEINEKIKRYILDNPNESLSKNFIQKLIQEYYITFPLQVELFEVDKKQWKTTCTVKVGEIEISCLEMTEKFKECLCKLENTKENTLKKVWTDIQQGNDCDNNIRKLKKILGEENISSKEYNDALKVLDYDKEGFKEKCKELYGVLPF